MESTALASHAGMFQLLETIRAVHIFAHSGVHTVVGAQVGTQERLVLQVQLEVLLHPQDI